MSPSPSTVRGSPKADRATSTDDVSDDGSSNPAVKTILNSRKCWRNMKGKEEAVWPPDLEAALIGGLEKYRPAEAKSNRVLGRFPMRNKFVADHIFETTGQRRTPKQVGSRIQQLRDTSSGKHILKAISDKHYEMMHPKKSATDEQEAGPSRRKTQLLQPSKTATLSAPTPMLAHVYINTLPPHYSWLPSAGSPIPLSSIYSQEAKPLRTIDPTVSFTSAEQTPCQAFFQLYKAGQFVQQEYAPVSISCGPLSETGAPLFTYSTTLVPQHWSYLCEVEDLPAYTIYLEVVRLPLSSAPHSPTIALSSVLYHFVDATTYTFAASTPPLSPRSSCGEGEFDFPPLSSGSTPSPLLDSIMLTTPLLGGVDSSGAVPELLFNVEDEYSSLPGSPLEFPTLDGQPWSYTPSPNVLPRSPLFTSSSPHCDPYLEAAALFDAFVYQ